MNFVSLFSGIGGLDLGLEWAGMTCLAQVERDKFCLKVLEKHWPNVPRFTNVLDVGAENLPMEPDLLCGGFPCQDVSLAGARRGLDGKRSTLWTEFHRIICEIKPRWVLVENVQGLLSANSGEFFARVLKGLADLGYDAEWNLLPASAIGAPHVRSRLFIVAYSQRYGRLPSGGVLGRERAGHLFGKWPTSNSEEERKHFWIKATGGSKAEIERPNPVISGEWAIEPAVDRVANGVPNRVDRIRSLGNAVVPQVARYIGRCIMDVDEEINVKATSDSAN